MRTLLPTRHETRSGRINFLSSTRAEQTTSRDSKNSCSNGPKIYHVKTIEIWELALILLKGILMLVMIA